MCFLSNYLVMHCFSNKEVKLNQHTRFWITMFQNHKLPYALFGKGFHNEQEYEEYLDICCYILVLNQQFALLGHFKLTKQGVFFQNHVLGQDGTFAPRHKYEICRDLL